MHIKQLQPNIKACSEHHTCSLDRCLSTLLVSVACFIFGASTSMLFNVNSLMYAFSSVKPLASWGKIWSSITLCRSCKKDRCITSHDTRLASCILKAVQACMVAFAVWGHCLAVRIGLARAGNRGSCRQQQPSDTKTLGHVSFLVYTCHAQPA